MTSPRSSIPWVRRLGIEIAVVAILICAHGWMAISVSRHHSPTFDEVAHLGGGFMGWSADDDRFNAESGVIPQRWATLPWMALDLQAPAPEDPARRSANVWAVGREVLYGSSESAQRLLLLGRAMIALLGMGTAALVYLWSRRVFGRAGGMVSLGACVFSPTLLAHDGLATADAAAACFFLLASLSIWWWLERVTPSRTLCTGLAIGALLLSKMSGLLIVPIAAFLIAARLLSRRPLVLATGDHEIRLPAPVRRVVAVLVAASILCWLSVMTIWAAYGFRYRAQPGDGAADSTFLHEWRTESGDGAEGFLISHLRTGRWLPEAYLWGLDYTLGTTHERDAFLSGRTSKTGWWWFFPYAFLVKTPIPFFGLLLLAAAAFARRPPPWRPLTPLVVLIVVYLVATLSSGLNIGHRHLLPIYPPLFILAGCAGRWFEFSLTSRPLRFLAALTLLLLGLHAADSFRIRPHYLAYFNALAGGPENGYRHLVDSSLDWGQDLPGLADWIRHHDQQNPTEPVFIAYFGSASPRDHGVEGRWLHSYFRLADPFSPPQELEPGVYCVSVTLLQSLHQQLLGPWTAERESSYRLLRDRVARFRTLRVAPEGAAQLAREGSQSEWMQVFEDYERLQSGRLFHYLRQQAPMEQIGYSINVYRLDALDLAAADRSAGALETHGILLGFD